MKMIGAYFKTKLLLTDCNRFRLALIVSQASFAIISPNTQ